MAEIARIEKLNVVMLKVTLSAAREAIEQMNLATPLTRRAGNPSSYWYGPDCWYLASNSKTANEIINECETRLGSILYNAVDYSASLAAFRVSGNDASDILASGTGIDLRPSKFPADSSNRTRLAGILAMITARENGYELFVERSYARYMEDWLNDTASIISMATAS
mgnify:CR=1 FL=1